MDKIQERSLIEAVRLLLSAENRYKDGVSDEQWSDAEMAANKRKAREAGVAILKELHEYNNE